MAIEIWLINNYTHKKIPYLVPANQLSLADGKFLVVLIDNGDGRSANTNETDSTGVSRQLSSTLSGHSVRWIEDGTS